jgi:hypothetical protein
MEDTVQARWRSFVPFTLTAIVIGSGLGFAFS